MNIVKKITTGSLALVLATGTAGSALANANGSSGDLSVQIDPMSSGGVLSASISSYDFGTYEYSIVDQQVAGQLVVNASDLRGNASGWNVTISGTDFNQDNQFGIANLSLEGDSVSTTSNTGHSTEKQPELRDVQAVFNSEESTILTANVGTGAGTYDATYDATLNIPAGTLVGSYDATVTVTITGNEPGAPADG